PNLARRAHRGGTASCYSKAAANAGVPAIGLTAHGIGPASVTAGCARKPPAAHLWPSFASRLTKCSGSRRQPCSRVQTALSAAFALYAEPRSPTATSAVRTLAL